MFSIGSTIRDAAGNSWIVATTWTYNEFLCLALVGAPNTPMMGQMGGARFRSGDEILVRR